MKVEFQSQIDAAKFLHVVAADFLNQMRMEERFWLGIPNDKKFDFASPMLTGFDLKKIMRVWMQRNKITLSFYRSSWFFRGVVGHVKKGQARTVYFNTRHYDFTKLEGESLKDDIKDKIRTISHELVHVVDGLFPHTYFGHGDNNPAGKENSFPVWFGNYCAEYFEKHHGDLENSRILKVLKKD